MTPADGEVTVKVLEPAPVAVAICVAVKLLFCGDAKIENVVWVLLALLVLFIEFTIKNPT